MPRNLLTRLGRMPGANPRRDETDASRAHRLKLIDDMTFEVIPLKSLPDAEAALPAGAEVSVTASPAKGLEATQEITERLLAAGFQAIPHISARMVRDRQHTRELAQWFRTAGVSTLFIVGGDADPPGDYPDAIEFLADLLNQEHGLHTIGVTAYPDGHATISNEKLHEALHDKQALLDEAGLAGYCSTQMCFDPKLIERWIRAERAEGLTLPVHLGLSGVVDRTKLLTMGARLGIGQSLSYLRKNRRAITSMMTTASYDPNDLLVPLSGTMHELDFQGLHVFTFNQVAATDQWRRQQLATAN
jgi:methylenetetrahydrofolate reductase (NADPH)